jgi:Flp pilus assembly protein CpaB
MQQSSSPVPVVVALIVAVIGVAVLFGMDFGLRHPVPNVGIDQTTRAALARAGAAEMPTQPNDL